MPPSSAGAPAVNVARPFPLRVTADSACRLNRRRHHGQIGLQQRRTYDCETPPPNEAHGAKTPDTRSDSGRYTRTITRKVGEGLELAGKAVVAAAAAAEGAPLIGKGHLAIPTVTIAVLFIGGLVLLLIGYHLQAKAKPDG